jgi:hypothetical protein
VRRLLALALIGLAGCYEAQAQVSPGGGGLPPQAGAGISVSGYTVSCKSADAGVTGCIDSSSQKFGGAKSFLGLPLEVNGNGATNGNVLLSTVTSTDSACIQWRDNVGNKGINQCWGNSGLSSPYASSLNFFAFNTTSPDDITFSGQTKGGELARINMTVGTISTQAVSGAAAYTSLQGAKTCYDGATCAKTISYDGSNIVLAGATSMAGSMTVTGNIVTTGTLTEQSTGNNLLIGGRASNGASAEAIKFYNQNTLSTALGEIASFYSDSAASTKVAAVDKDGSYWFKGNPTLVTCASTTEGYVSRDVGSGVSTGHRTRLCLCVSDGAGSPAYAWQNMVSGTVGTTTTCSD